MSENWWCIWYGLTWTAIWFAFMRLIKLCIFIDELVLPLFLSGFISDCLEEIRNPTPLKPVDDKDFIRFGIRLPCEDENDHDQETTAKDD